METVAKLLIAVCIVLTLFLLLFIASRSLTNFCFSTLGLLTLSSVGRKERSE